MPDFILPMTPLLFNKFFVFILSLFWKEDSENIFI